MIQPAHALNEVRSSASRSSKSGSFHIPRAAWIIAVVFALITSAPYVIGVLRTPPGSEYSGGATDLKDYYSHLAKMTQGARGEWLYQLLFTSETHPPILLQTFYIALGHIARWTGATLPTVYHAARIFFSILMVITLYWFTRRFLSERLARWATGLALFTGGAGLLLYTIPGAVVAPNISPIELWLIDAYMLFSAVCFPHFAAAISLLLLSLLFLDRYSIAGTGSDFVGFLVCAGLLGFIAPFHLLLVALLFGLVIIVRRPAFGIFAIQIFGVMAAVIGGSQLAALDTDPVWQAFSAQNVTLSPGPHYYILGWLPLFIPAALNLIRIVRSGASERERLLIPLGWAVIAFALLYAPLNTQRRFSLAYQAPLAILAVDWFAAVGLPWLRARFRRRWRTVAILYLGLACTSTIVMPLVWIGEAGQPDRRYDADTLGAFGWIREFTPPDAVILAPDALSGPVVAQTGRRIVAYHWAETKDYEVKKAAVARFYSVPGADDPTRIALLKDQRVAAVIYQKNWRGVIWPPLPALPVCLISAYETPTLTVFKVDKPCAATSP